jgi:probable rRNA maturation factor
VRDEAEQKGASAARSFGARRCRGAVGAIQVEVENRSEVEVEVDAAVALARRLLEEEGIDEAELGIAFVGPNESRALKREYLGIDEATDVLSFPIDGRDPLPADVPRQLGDVVLCPAVVGEQWRRPLAHGLLHLLGYEHGAEMERREESYAA